MAEVKIKYIGHAAFKLSGANVEIVIDPYEDGTVPGLAPMHEEADYVYCSHGHFDHNYVQAVSLRPQEREMPFALEELDIPHDDCEGTKRGTNTARVFTVDGLKIAHMGDTGRGLTEGEIKQLSGLDCLLIPVGGFFTIDAQRAKTIVEQVKPRVVIPMHYRKGGIGFDVIGTVEPFLEGMQNVNYGGSEFVLTSDAPEQVLVMTPAAAQE